MFKPKPNFFGDSPQHKPSNQVKKQLTSSKQQYESVAIPSPSFTNHKMTKSQVLPARRLATSFVANRKDLVHSKYENGLTRGLPEKKSVYQRKTSSSAYMRNRSVQQKWAQQAQQQKKQKGSEIADAQFQAMAEQIQQQYLQLYNNQNYQGAANVLIKILNYTIDSALPKHFLRTIKQIAQFYFLINRPNFAVFYFNQCRICSFKLNDPEMLVDSLIGCALCCRKEEMFEEAILFLKKGLEFCWYHGRGEQELRIYDQFGKVYYLMGQLEKANNFHEKFLNAVLEPDNSPQRSLSKQRLSKLYTDEDFKICQQIDVIFLTSLSLPILSFKELPPLPNTKQNIRQNFTISTKYFNQVPEVSRLIAKILLTQFFANQMEEPESAYMSKHASFSKKKKFDFIDFKLKQHLKEMGIGYKTKIEIKPKNLEYREPLDEKVRKKLKQPALDPDWQFKMVRQIKRDRQNKLFKVHSQIRVRGKNRLIRPEIDHIRKIFMPLFN